MEYYVYILRSKKDGSLYTGYTTNIHERLKRHNSGRVTSTKGKLPLEMVYFEKRQDLDKALAREKYLKSSKAKGLKHSFKKGNILSNYGGYSSIG
jgi:putative endonuclease